MKSNSVNIHTKGELKYITFPKFDACNLVNHAFTTRLGGKSEGYFSSMNMSFNRGDSTSAVKENYSIICSAIGTDTNNLVFTKQTHTNNVITVTEKHRGTGFTKPSFCDVDGLVTNCKNVALVTQFADCTPLLFCDTEKGVIASSHSGWRGTVKQIGKVTVEKMVNEFGCNTNDIIAAIGPCICKECYEVDTPVYEKFKELPIDISDVFTRIDGTHFLLDLRLANKKILLLAGIKEENIDIADICPCCNKEEMFSHRAQGTNRGNLAAIIELK